MPPPCQSLVTVGRQADPHVPVVLLGVGKRSTIIRAAQRDNIDVVLMFDIEERQVRGGSQSKSVQLAVVDAWTNRDLLRPQEVNYLQRKNRQTDPLYEDPIERIEQKFQEVLSKELAPGAFPAQIRPAHALSRVKVLARLKRDNPLALLAEMKLYRQLELISVAELMTGYQQLLGSDSAGAELLAGTAEERRAAIERWIPDLKAELERATQRRMARDDDD